MTNQQPQNPTTTLSVVQAKIPKLTNQFFGFVFKGLVVAACSKYLFGEFWLSALVIIVIFWGLYVISNTLIAGLMHYLLKSNRPATRSQNPPAATTQKTQTTGK